jgi:hypothetical protein
MGLNKQILSSGSLGIFDITDDLVVRVVVENAGATNNIVIRGRIKGQAAFTTLQNIAGSISTTVTVATYDEIEIDCTVYDSLSSSVKVIATSFDQDVSSTGIPVGAATAVKQDVGNASLASIDSKTPALVGGKVPVDVSSISGTVEITNDVGNAIPISAASLPLPTGAATSADQVTANASLSSIDSKLGALGQNSMANSASVAIASDQTAIPVSAAALPLPTGAATESTLSILNTKVPANLTVSSTRLLVDNSGVTQPVSGSVSVSNLPATQDVEIVASIPAGTNNIGDVDVASLPISYNAGATDAQTQRVIIASDQSAIPISGTITASITGVSTEAKQDVGNTSLSSIDSKIPSLTLGGRLPVDIGGNGSITVTSGTITVQNEVEVNNDVGNPIPVSALSLPLPTGAATSANQTNGNQKSQLVDGSGNVISSTSNALDVNVKSGVALTVELSEANDSVAVFGNDGTTNRALKTDANGELQIDVLSSALPTGAATSALQTTGNASLSSIDGKLTTSVNGLLVDGSAVTQPVSASSLPLPLGAATETTLLALNTKVPANLTVSSTRLLVDNSGVTQPVSASSLPLPTGAATELTLDSVKTAVESLETKDFATEATLSSINTEVNTLNSVDFATENTLSSINTKIPSLGQAAMTGSSPVVIASDQSAIPASQSGTWNINNVSGTVSLPTGASTSALQTTGNTSLSNIDGKLPATLGQKVSNDSLSVVIASDQSPLPISGTISSTQVSGVEDLTNSSTTPLLANGVFTGAAFNVTGYVSINVNVKSDVPSATGGVKVEFSTDGVNWDHSHSTSYTAATGVGYIFNVEYKYARIVYTNGTSPQTYFRLQTIFKTTLTKSSLYTLSQAINSNMFAELGRSVITGETTGGGGGYVNVKVDPSGAMITATTIDTALPAGTNNIGDVDVATLPIAYNAGATDAQTQRVVVANDQTIPISASSLPLPTGAATSALQTTGNSTLSSFSAKSGASMVAVAHDEVVVTYVGATTLISTVVYKLATVTVATLTFSYDGSNRLIGVVRS